MPEGDEAQRSATRHFLARRLLDDPVVYLDELDPAQREYFSNQRGPLSSRLRDATYLVPEQRAEGVAMIDPDGDTTDARLPAIGTVAHATLLVADFLLKRCRSDPNRRTSLLEIAVFLRRASVEYGRFWSKKERGIGADTELARSTIEHLRKLQLITLVDGDVWPRPALARYGLGAPELTRKLPQSAGDKGGTHG